MSDENKVEVTETEQVESRGRGRPRKETPNEEKVRVTRGTRVPLGGFAGPLTLIKENLDPEMHYSWPLDDNENGSKIERLLQAGYAFCSPEENLVAGKTSVYASVSQGSMVRVPAGQGKYHYLMKIPQEWYEEDQARHQKLVDATEGSLHNKLHEEGFYGDLKIG